MMKLQQSPHEDLSLGLSPGLDLSQDFDFSPDLNLSQDFDLSLRLRMKS